MNSTASATPYGLRLTSHIRPHHWRSGCNTKLQVQPQSSSSDSGWMEASSIKPPTNSDILVDMSGNDPSAVRQGVDPSSAVEVAAGRQKRQRWNRCSSRAAIGSTLGKQPRRQGTRPGPAGAEPRRQFDAQTGARLLGHITTPPLEFAEGLSPVAQNATVAQIATVDCRPKRTVAQNGLSPKTDCRPKRTRKIRRKK